MTQAQSILAVAPEKVTYAQVHFALLWGSIEAVDLYEGHNRYIYMQFTSYEFNIGFWSAFILQWLITDFVIYTYIILP